MCQLVLPEEIATLLVSTLRGLTDPEVQAASGTCVLLNGVLRIRGAELAPRVKDLVAGFMQRYVICACEWVVLHCRSYLRPIVNAVSTFFIFSMSEIKSDMTMNGTLHSLRSLAHHHLPAVLDELLTAPIPHPPYVLNLSTRTCMHTGARICCARSRMITDPSICAQACGQSTASASERRSAGGAAGYAHHSHPQQLASHRGENGPQDQGPHH